MIEKENNSDLVDIIILGNGFDIANNYKTSYSDFIKSYEFNSLLKNNHLAQKINEQHNIQNWVDVEMEIANYSNDLYNKYNNNIPSEIDSVFSNEFYEISNALYLFISKARSYKTNPIMESLITNWVERSFFEQKRIYVLTFNYLKFETSLLLNKKPKELFIFGNPTHVHGIASNENNIVLGVDRTNIKCNSHSFLIKEFNRNTETRHFFSYVDKADRIIIFGSSLGRTDYRYFKSLFNNRKNIKYDIYCFKEKEYLNIKNNIMIYTDYNQKFYDDNEVTFYDSSIDSCPIIYSTHK
jgi:hypothetical protein